MKTAIKVLLIIEAIGYVIAFILALTLQGPIKELITWSYDNGELIVNDKAATKEEFEVMLSIVPVVCGVVAVLMVISIGVLALDFYFVSKDSINAILVFGIIFCAIGNIVMGVLQVVYYVMENKKQTVTE